MALDRLEDADVAHASEDCAPEVRVEKLSEVSVHDKVDVKNDCLVEIGEQFRRQQLEGYRDGVVAVLLEIRKPARRDGLADVDEANLHAGIPQEALRHRIQTLPAQAVMKHDNVQISACGARQDGTEHDPEIWKVVAVGDHDDEQVAFAEGGTDLRLSQ